MKESIGNALLFYIIITFVIILIAFFVGSLSYSKAFKVKNRIIETIEKEEGFTANAKTEIDEWLKAGENGKSGIGYRVNTNGGNANSTNCATVDGGTLVNPASNYQYCVYELTSCGKKADEARCGKYYRVTTYMFFDVPVIGDMIKIPVSGETKTFVKINS